MIFRIMRTFVLLRPIKSLFQYNSILLQGLSRIHDGLLIAELDLNLCRQVRDHWGFQVGVVLYIIMNSVREEI